MEEPPGEDGSGDDQQAEGLVSPKGAALGLTPLFFGDLLGVRLDPAFDHFFCAVQGSIAWGTTHQYRKSSVGGRSSPRRRRIQFGKQAGPQGFVDEGCAERFAVAGCQLVITPCKGIAKAGVFLLEGHVGDGSGVGVDA